jgi:hypothetical protein
VTWRTSQQEKISSRAGRLASLAGLSPGGAFFIQVAAKAAAIYFSYRHKSNRGDKTAIELFVAGVRGWEAGLRRRLEDGKPNRD